MSAVIISDQECVESYKCRKALELSIPVLSAGYIHECVIEGSLKDHDEFIAAGLSRTGQLGSGKISGLFATKKTEVVFCNI